MARSVAGVAKDIARSVLPLSLRMKLCLFLNRRKFFSGDTRYWWTRELLRDYAAADTNGYHRFLWSNHLAYAVTYNVDARFGNGRIPESRRMFFEDLETHLRAAAIEPARDVRSVFEVGCSLGYQLRYLETSLFTGAVELAGIDIDRYAIEQGAEHLGRSKSRVRLTCGDMGDLDRLLDGKRFDVMINTGVLMYLGEAQAVEVVETMLRHTGMLIGLSGPAHADADNATLERPGVRKNDGSFIHNLDAIVTKAGGTVVGRRWEGSRLVDGHTIYFVFARNGQTSPRKPR